MRFVSNSAGLGFGSFRPAVQALSEPRSVTIEGKQRIVEAEPYTIREAVRIQFSRIDLSPPDIQTALAKLSWPGNTLEEDHVTPTSPVERMGVWDSYKFQEEYGLTDEERVEAEQKLLHDPNYGSAYVLVEEIEAPKPWPTYDETHHNKIPLLAEELGCIDAVLAYERERKNRASVLAAVEARLPKAEQPAGEIVHA